jgi:hypothetical protein
MDIDGNGLISYNELLQTAGQASAPPFPLPAPLACPHLDSLIHVQKITPCKLPPFIIHPRARVHSPP